MRFSIAATSSSPLSIVSWSRRVTRQVPLAPTIGTMALPVMSPPMTRTSALWNAPAFRNFRQQTSEPWMSVAKKIRTGPPRGGLVVPDFLGLDVPLLALADRRAKLPARGLGRALDRGAQRSNLGARIEQHGPMRADVHILGHEVGIEVLLQLVEIARDRSPPAPVVRGERQDPRQAD